MKKPPITVAVLLALGLAAGCQSSEKQPDPATASSPAPASAPAASSPATLSAPLPPLTSVDVRPGVEQLLPKEGYLQVVSAKMLKADAMQLTLPPLWGSLQSGAARTMPGYRIAYEAVLRWTPTGYGKGKVPASQPLYVPNGRDSLARFSLGGINFNVPGAEKYTVSDITPDKPVTVSGVLYAFADPKQSRLIVYPYRNKGGVADASKFVSLPLTQ
jgi:hypothetical protein